MIIALAAMTSAKAINYEEARQQAWFLTDKMAYELNLTPEQYDRAYQVNLDYLMSLGSAADCTGPYWTYRNADMRCILFDWQYNLYSTIEYFYRPIRWVRVGWVFPIFDHYRRGYFYFDRPTVYVSYRGGMWNRRGHNTVSPYRGMTFRPGAGMRDRYDRGHNGVRPGARPNYGRPGYNPQRPGQGGSGRPGSNAGVGQGRPDGSRPGGSVTRPGNQRPGSNTGSSGRPSVGNGRPSSGNVGSGNRRPSGSGSSTPSSGKTSQRGHSGSARTFGR